MNEEISKAPIEAEYAAISKALSKVGELGCVNLLKRLEQEHRELLANQHTEQYTIAINVLEEFTTQTSTDKSETSNHHSSYL